MSRTVSGYSRLMGENVHDIEPAASPKLWATLHQWAPDAGEPFPTEQNQLGQQQEIAAGSEVSFPEVTMDGLVFLALWRGGALLWRSEVRGMAAGQKMSLTLPGIQGKS